ncbi:MAG TPA: SGNH/GDSL hydrolase family protein [Trebonia sp.]|jgi:lysophospholipase L1-like esterase|nr:SGNH/GDSL hydrolase family protein [Trebonia sp.]
MKPRYLFPVSGEETPGPVSFVAIGDSFTEGLNDPAPGGGFRGWADRLAGLLAAGRPDLRYANLAVRGKLLRQIAADQVPAALDLLADRVPGSTALVSIAGGGNDILRPGADPDTLAELFGAAIARLRAGGCEVLMFTGFDPTAFPVMRLLRGRIAAYNMHLRALADDHDCYLVDLWSMRVLRDPRAWSADRLHLGPDAHRRIALRSCEVLGVPVAEDWRAPLDGPEAAAAAAGADLAVARPGKSTTGSAAKNAARAAWMAARREDARWTRAHFVPWVNRRLHGTSSGDDRTAKRPALESVTPPVTM